MRKILLMSLVSSILLTGAVVSYKMRDGSTPPILNDDGWQLPGSIASLEKIELGGMEQWILIRGKDLSNPVLLWLHGGPGAAQMPVAPNFSGALEEHFIVVHWDQRGAGKSNPAEFDESTMALQQFLSDAHELTLYLKNRFGKDKIYLLGHSWGSQLGIRLAEAYPPDYHAYVGVSQVISSPIAQEIGYDWLLEQVMRDHDEKNLKVLQSLGEPPFTEHEEFVRYVQLIDAYGGGFDIGMARLSWIALWSPEYSLSDMIAWLRGATRGSGPMWNSPDYQAFNALEDITRIDVPVYFFNGRQDYNTPLSLIERYVQVLDAPRGKELVILEESAHTPFLGQPEEFNREIIRVKAETYQTR